VGERDERGPGGDERGSGGSVYHVEMRQFPHNMCRFNLSLGELRAKILEPWAQEHWVEFGERKWSPHQATLTVLEGPRIPFGQLTMGRGWRTAQRSAREVTEELLETVRAELVRPPAAPAVASPLAATSAAASPGAAEPAGSPGRVAGPETPAGERQIAELAADSLGLELLAQLGSEPVALRRAWELAAERTPGSSASAALALAEGAVESLLRARLVVLVGIERGAGSGEGGGSVEGAEPREGDAAARIVGAIASWDEPGAVGAVAMRRV
jgi:hypothetical protein